jgi:glycerol-3-phosphate acyltransferase PlsY
MSFAVLVSRLFGLPDPRSYGSGNPGATNVLRTGKRAAAALTLLGDGGKGWLSVWIAQIFQIRYELDPGVAAIVGLAAFAGHLWPVFFRFQGGKGVATAGGILLAIHLWLGVATIGAWLAVFLLFRYSSLAALVAAIVAPCAALLMLGLNPEAWTVMAISVLLIVTHRSNIQRLLSGSEGKFGRGKSDKGSA